jgi:uncharacterized protein (DUF1501 family)
LLGRYSVKAMNVSPELHALLNAGAGSDHVLVLVQLNGGNDGLNTVIPLEGYADYFNVRKNIAIPNEKVLRLTAMDKVGLHPAMNGMRDLYDRGRIAVVQSVGYPNPNFSHFRATDIWMSGSDSDQLITTGWMGRMLSHDHPDYPNGYPNPDDPDPLAIQIGSITSLAVQGPLMSMGMSITSATDFYNLVDGVLDPVPGGPMGKELAYVRLIAQQTKQYSESIKTAAAKVADQLAYPADNGLADQLKIVARLIKGGLKTRVYMVSAGGFDTHSVQVQGVDTTVGHHAELLGGVSDAIKAFMDDLKHLGIQDRVLGMTFSEFGRRIKSNSSLGTDHGAAAPVFLFGGQVQGGVLGRNPDIPAQASVEDNIPFQYDFRSVYATILQDWFCTDQQVLQTVLLKNFQTLPLLRNGSCSLTMTSATKNTENLLISSHPNPFTQRTRIVFKSAGGHILIQIMNGAGQVVRVAVDADYPAGEHTVDWDSGALSSGVYYARYQSGTLQQVWTMVKVRG